MLTLKQIEAFFWASRLSSFSRAAAKLCMTQSALSKRVSELEAGRALLETAERMLELRQQMYVRTGADAAPAGLVAFGVTELAAGTWLPRWVADMRRTYPAVTLEPYVDLSSVLAARLRAGEIEMAVMPLQLSGPEFTSIQLQEVAFSMMAAPGVVPSGALTHEDLERLPVFAQSGGSGLTEVFEGWSRANGLSMQRVLASNSLVAISELVLAGLGIALLPVAYYQRHLDQGRLCAVSGPLPWPRLPYYLVTRTGPGSGPLRALQRVALQKGP